MSRSGARQRLFVPEVIQTSAMDCGPAALKCLLEGFGISVSYGRLREACQTEVDGTSIDTLEDIARQLGLDAEQIMLPVDTLLLSESDALPAIVVMRHPSGFTHFVVLWRRHGPLVQMMDPGTGRIWMTRARFLRNVYVHELRLPAADWHEWAKTGGNLQPLARRLEDLGIDRSSGALIETAAGADDWRDLATLDAATSLVTALVRAGGIRRGREAERVLRSFIDRSRSSPPGAGNVIPEAYWSARPSPLRPGEEEADQTGEVLLRGAVLVRIRGPRPRGGTRSTEAAGSDDASAPAPNAPADDVPPAGEASESDSGSEVEETSSPPSAELAAALAEAPPRPAREILRLLRGDGVLTSSVLLLGLAVSAGSVFLEALLLRGVFDLGRDLKLVTQRLEAAGCFLIFIAAVLLVELRVASSLMRLGRRLETRMRLAFLQKIPRLVDRYFQSRPVSDMAERSHSTHHLRTLPKLGGQLVRATFGLVVTAAAIAWIYPEGALFAFAAAVVAVALPLAFKPHLDELDLRVRTQTGALSRFYLDALLGLGAVRAHGAERAVRREHEGLLVEWTDASLRHVRTGVLMDGLQSFSGFGFAALLVFLYAGRSGEPSGALLVAYWALYLPALGEEVAMVLRQYPTHRNLTLRLLEPLGAPEEESDGAVEPGATDGDGALPPRESPGDIAAADGPEGARARSPGISISLESVTVRAAGHTILEGVDLAVAPGEHVAIVGASGAGKSSLVGLLLGWHRPSSGRVLVDGEALTASCLDRLRRETVWVDPAVQVWNRSLLANLTYGAERPGGDGAGDGHAVARVLEDADLLGVLQRLPDGLQSPLGEGGGLLSGGEGQRVRLGRGLMRAAARLVVLDEPFRGLDHAKRRQLVERVRERWKDATLLCVTHDVGETRSFERVLVVDGGGIVEDAAPLDLASDRRSRYRAILDAEEKVRAEIWSGSFWRRLRLGSGRLVEEGNGEANAPEGERRW